MNLPFSDRPSVTFLIGGLGAGKTELSINLAVYLAHRRGDASVDLLDLDIVNPFFRVRKVKDDLEKEGVRVVIPDSRVANGDLPALPASVWSALENPERTIVCDVGGGELGLRPLGRLTEYSRARETQVLFVMNPFRPGFLTAADRLASFRHMENLSALKVTHIVANPHLVKDTTPEIFLSGWKSVAELADAVGKPVAFGMVMDSLLSDLPETLQTQVFPIQRFWAVPWAFGIQKKI
jgi:hypothetical protein